jgi:hypothetical protein
MDHTLRIHILVNIGKRKRRSNEISSYPCNEDQYDFIGGYSQRPTPSYFLEPFPRKKENRKKL